MNQRLTLLLVIIISSLSGAGCVNANEGVYKIQTVRGQINQIIKPSDGWVNVTTTIGDEYYDFSLRSFTENVEVQASTKDNAAVKLEIHVTVNPPSTDDEIKAFVRKFGLEEKDRLDRLVPLLKGQVNTETKNAVIQHEAYGLLASQAKIQQDLVSTLTKIFKEQMHLGLDSVQIIGRPDFLDDRIEQAASAVVANQKGKEAAEAALATAKVDAEKKQVEAQTFANPALLQIKILELQKDIETARANGIAHHQGPLTLIYDGKAGTQVQLRNQ